MNPAPPVTSMSSSMRQSYGTGADSALTATFASDG